MMSLGLKRKSTVIKALLLPDTVLAFFHVIILFISSNNLVLSLCYR